MIYGMYLSASGILANSYRQDVIANNLANSETVGFRRDLATFQDRGVAKRDAQNLNKFSDPALDNMTGGVLASPTLVDTRQGDLEHTGNNLDIAIQGSGYFAVANGSGKHLTRDGQFMVDAQGNLTLSTDQHQQVLDEKQRPIHVAPGAQVRIRPDRAIEEDGKVVGKLGLFDVRNPSAFAKDGGNLMKFPDSEQLTAAAGDLHPGFQEHSNVDPATELAELMDTQRQLEANANMLKTQDTMLQELVNNVGKIS